jgi:hypothetical protein
MKRPLLTSGAAGLVLSLLSGASPSPAHAREIALGDVRITAPERREARAAVTPWSGTWWPMASGKLALGWNGTAADFTYDPATKRYARASASAQKPSHDLAPFLKYDAWRHLVTGADLGSALVELHGEGRFSHHVYGDEKERLDREGISYSWWGHCNGWCAAAILEREPIAPVDARGVRFEVADLKGLLTESHFGVESDFTGRRYNAPRAAHRAGRDTARALLAALTGNAPRPVAEYIAWYEAVYETTMSAAAKAAAKPADFKDELESFERWYVDNYDTAYSDLAPDVFHKLLESVIGQRRLAFVADITCNEEVWNHPAYAYDATIEQARTFSENGGARTEWSVRTIVTYATDGVSESVLGVEAFTRTYTYTLVTDDAGKLLRGAWTGASVDDHPDFAWLPTRNSTGADSSENPKVLWGDVTTLLPQSHGAATARPFDVSAAGVTASSRRASDRTTTWSQPVSTGLDVALGARAAGNVALARVAYFEQRLNASGATPIVTRDALVALGESTTGPGFEVTARVSSGKRMVLAYGYDASGRLLGVDEITVQAGGGNTPPPQTDDAFEQNDTAAAAAAIAPGVYRDLLCNDEDWFAVTLAAPGALTVQLAFSHAAGDLDLGVDGPSGSVGTSEGTGDSEKVEVASLPAGTYKVRVHGYQGARGRYTLTISAATVTPPAPSDDRFEENDTRAQAAAIAAGAYPGLACNDDDWFKVTLAAESSLAVKLDFRHAEGDIELEVTDAAGARLGSSTSAADGELVSKERLAAGTYLVRVYGYRGAKAAYGLTVTATPTSGPAPTTRTGTITASTLNVRRGPATTFAIAGTVRLNAVVTILEERSGWYRVTYPGAPTGELWVSKSYVRAV